MLGRVPVGKKGETTGDNKTGCETLYAVLLTDRSPKDSLKILASPHLEMPAPKKDLPPGKHYLVEISDD